MAVVGTNRSRAKHNADGANGPVQNPSAGAPVSYVFWACKGLAPPRLRFAQHSGGSSQRA